MQSQNKLISLDNSSKGLTKKKPIKTTHVPTACINCKKAHLACDLSRPCKRCSTLGKSESCIDIKHKKRGRPKLSSTKILQQTTHSTPSALPPKLHAQQLLFSSMNVPALIPFHSHITNSFKLTASKERPLNEGDNLPIELMTLFLSMDLCCARASDESVQFLDVDPNDLKHCSLYGLIHPESSETLSRLHRILLDNCHHHVTRPLSFTPASSDMFLTTSPAQLLMIANGSQTIREALKFKAAGGSYFDCRFYLGGGFGGDLFAPATLNQLYMVCVVSRSSNNISNRIASSFNVVESFLANDMAATNEQQQDYQAIFNDPALLSLCNSTGTNDDQAMQLVTHLCEAIIPPTASINNHQSPTCYTTATGYNSSSGSSSTSSVDGGSSSHKYKHHSTSSISSSRSGSISERFISGTAFNQEASTTSIPHAYSFEQSTSSILDEFVLSATTGSQKLNSTPMSEIVGGLIHDNNAYWLG